MGVSTTQRAPTHGKSHAMAGDVPKQIIHDRARALVRRQGLRRPEVASFLAMLAVVTTVFAVKASCFAAVVSHYTPSGVIH